MMTGRCASAGTRLHLVAWGPGPLRTAEPPAPGGDQRGEGAAGQGQVAADFLLHRTPPWCAMPGCFTMFLLRPFMPVAPASLHALKASWNRLTGCLFSVWSACGRWQCDCGWAGGCPCATSPAPACKSTAGWSIRSPCSVQLLFQHLFRSFCIQAHTRTVLYIYGAMLRQSY